MIDRRRMNRLLVVLLTPLFLALAVATAAEPDPLLTDLDRRVLRELTGEKRLDQLVLHYRPGDLTPEQLDQCARDNARSFRELERLLDMRYSGTVHIFLYRDGADLKQRTESDAVAFSTGTVSVHQPFDFVSVHELCHIFALQFPRVADGVSDIFVVEGLATALAESDENVPIHAWAAVYARVRRLPTLWEFRWRWPDKTPPAVHPYHVAGSFVGFLIERFGVAKVKNWYVDATEAKSVFGQSFPALERDWREWLDKYPLDPRHEKHVLTRLNLMNAKLSESLAAAPGERLFDGSTLTGLEAEKADSWQARDGALVGTHNGPWTAIRSREKFASIEAVRVRFRMRDGNAFKILLESEGQAAVESILARWAGYLTCGEGYAGGESARIDDTTWHTAVVTWKGGRIAVFLDGFQIMECDQSRLSGDVRVGVAVERASVELSEVSIIKR
jgi:hypothetical protein